MDELVTWLRGVLDETERVARDATGEEWTSGPYVGLDYYAERGQAQLNGPGRGSTEDDEEPIWLVADAVHIARHDPRSVLARVEAERAIVELHRSGGKLCGGDLEEPSHWRDYCATCGSGEPCEYPVYWPCQTLLLLAYGHRHDAPGYRPEWAPEDVALSR